MHPQAYFGVRYYFQYFGVLYFSYSLALAAFWLLELLTLPMFFVVYLASLAMAYTGHREALLFSPESVFVRGIVLIGYIYIVPSINSTELLIDQVRGLGKIVACRINKA